MWILLGVLTLGFLTKYLNKRFYLLGGCKRFKTIDGSKLETKVITVPGKTIFGNNFDLIGTTPSESFQYSREITQKYKKHAYNINFIVTPIYSVATAKDAEEIFQSQALITKSHIYNVIKPLLGLGLLINTVATAKDAEEIFQSQALITKSVFYNIIKPFLGLGLLISSDDQWHSRRKLLTPAFHFNILKTFIEVFKEESHKFVSKLNESISATVILDEVVPNFTLNSICETAMGIKLDQLAGSDKYRQAIHDLEPIFIRRLCNPITFFISPIFWLTKDYRDQTKLANITDNFASQVIEKKRLEFLEKGGLSNTESIYGKKQRYAMLDTLLDAETKGLIDHQGICDEVNTFMFEGYDTTSTCIMFTLSNLALHQDIQQKCFKEIEQLGFIDDLTVFDFNKLEYLECVIKESLRLYPSVPFLARRVTSETIVNGIILPKGSEIHIHVFDILRDENHYPNPTKFDPERFKPENTTSRHPFAYVPFSAGPRNCIGQKFAMLEIKVLLVAILKNFKLEPVTNLSEVTLEGRLVLRTKEKLKVKFIKRK